MAAQLWMLRHGEAVPHDSKPDYDRELTPHGRVQAEAAGQALAALGAEFEACYASPRVRAWTTAVLACAALNVEPVRDDALANGFSRTDALALTEAHDGDLLVVGHEPSFSRVVYDFTGARVDFKKGGLFAVSARRTGGELLVALRPREIEAIAANLKGQAL